MIDNKQKAIALFINHTHYQLIDIVKTEQIHHGFTNVSFLFLTSDKNKYQVRLGDNLDQGARINEHNFLKTVNDTNYLYFDLKTGNAIKKWIEGYHPKYFKQRSINFLIKLNHAINQLHDHQIKQDNLIKHDFYEYLNLMKQKNIRMNQKHLDKYLILINKYKQMNKVPSHNDINPLNLLITNDQKIQFIDYEWARENYHYWDLANYLREIKISKRIVKKLAKKDQTIDYQTLLDFIYITTNYAYQWTYYMQETTKIIKYRKMVYKLMNKYYRWAKI